MKGESLPMDQPHMTPKTETVLDFTKQLLWRLVLDADESRTSNASIEEQGAKLYGLCLRLARRGKDDVRVPLRVIRDEIARCEFTSEMSMRNKQVETLFRVYDELERRANEGLGKAEEAEGAAVLFEELRQRFSRLVVGETWDDAPRLRMVALKRMYKYKVAERTVQRARSSLARSGSDSGGKLARAFSKLSSGGGGGGHAVGTWEDSFEELVKAPSPKLFPLIKLLLVDLGPEPHALASKVPPARDGGASENGSDSIPAARASRSPSDAADEGASKLTMHDLLDLDAAPTARSPAPAAAAAPANGVAATHTPTSGSTAAAPWQATFPQPAERHSFETPFLVPNGSSPNTAPAAPTNTAAAVPMSAPLRSQSSGTPSSPGAFNPFDLPESPYLGKPNPLCDNRFSDLSPLDVPLNGPQANAPARVGSLRSPHSFKF